MEHMSISEMELDPDKLILDQINREQFVDDEHYVRFGILIAYGVDGRHRHEEKDTEEMTADQSDISKAATKLIMDLIKAREERAVEEYQLKLKNN